MNLDKVHVNGKKFIFRSKKLKINIYISHKKKIAEEFFYWENYNKYLDRPKY